MSTGPNYQRQALRDAETRTAALAAHGHHWDDVARALVEAGAVDADSVPALLSYGQTYRSPRSPHQPGCYCLSCRPAPAASRPTLVILGDA